MSCPDVIRDTGVFPKAKDFGKSRLGGAVQGDYIHLLRTMKDADRSRLVCQVRVGRMDQTHSEEGWGVLGFSDDHEPLLLQMAIPTEAECKGPARAASLRLLVLTHSTQTHPELRAVVKKQARTNRCTDKEMGRARGTQRKTNQL